MSLLPGVEFLNWKREVGVTNVKDLSRIEEPYATPFTLHSRKLRLKLVDHPLKLLIEHPYSGSYTFLRGGTEGDVFGGKVYGRDGEEEELAGAKVR
jgi:hypothetical protein